MNLLEQLESEILKQGIPEFKVGDTVKVLYKVIEGNKERLQAYEGVVIARRNGGPRETFTVRRISFGVGVERTFPVHSPKIGKIEILKKGKVRRAKLYYLRKRTGKATKIKEAQNFVPGAGQQIPQQPQEAPAAITEPAANTENA